MFVAPILMSETTALRDGLKTALNAGYKHLHIEGDNRIVIQAVKDDIRISWRIQMLIHDIRAMSYVATLHHFRHSSCLSRR